MPFIHCKFKKRRATHCCDEHCRWFSQYFSCTFDSPEPHLVFNFFLFNLNLRLIVLVKLRKIVRFEDDKKGWKIEQITPEAFAFIL